MEHGAMLHLESLDAARLLQLLAHSRELMKKTEEMAETLERAFLNRQIKDLVEEHYDLGLVTDVFEIFGGYINRSFGFYAEKDGERHKYFLRRYRKGKSKKEILLEHGMLACAKQKGIDFVAAVIPTRKGKSYVELFEGDGEDRQQWYFAVYEFLKGEDKYSWLYTNLSDEEMASAGEVLARFHNAVKDFDPKDLAGQQPGILELLPLLRDKTFKEWAALDINNIFTEYFRENLPRICAIIDKLIIPEEDRAKLLLIPIQGDCHQGNMRFEDNKVVGVFDFDWAKVDLRVFELGLALVYFTPYWAGELDGVLQLDKCKLFLEAYQRKLQELGGLSPLNETEKKYLPEFINTGNIYLILWCVEAYYQDLTLNVFEYLYYLQHLVRCMNWVDKHREEIEAMIRELP